MPSLHRLLFVAFSASLLRFSSAAPVAACSQSASATSINVPSTTVSTSSAAVVSSSSSYNPSLPQKTPILPVNGGATELPAPTAAALRYVTVGRGVQNYSCSGAGSVPVAVGAVATLYDLSRLAKKNETALHEIPPTIVYQPISTVKNGTQINVPHHGDFPVIGKHYFAADGTPIFDLSAHNDILFCKKIAAVGAPANANIGPAGTGAVPWLNLSDKGGSVGLSEVYRVVTAGGKAPATCADSNLISIQYAAEYWFFG